MRTLLTLCFCILVLGAARAERAEHSGEVVLFAHLCSPTSCGWVEYDPDMIVSGVPAWKFFAYGSVNDPQHRPLTPLECGGYLGQMVATLLRDHYVGPQGRVRRIACVSVGPAADAFRRKMVGTDI